MKLYDLISFNFTRCLLLKIHIGATTTEGNLLQIKLMPQIFDPNDKANFKMFWNYFYQTYLQYADPKNFSLLE